MRCFRLLLIFVLNMFLANLAFSALKWQEVRIPMNTENGPITLEALLVFPDDQTKHPLALISHGSPRNGNERPAMSALSYLPIANEFARRGYSVAVVLRRGYGSSGGNWAEGFDSCASPNYMTAARAAAIDLGTATKYLATLRQFDTTKMIAVGVSAGGFATLALTALNPPEGLKAAISFAGGRGSLSSDHVCNEKVLIATFSEFGKTSRIPTLWVYAQNDHFFNPILAQKLLAAFKHSGGNALLVEPAPFGTEGHFLFSAGGISRWAPLVDNFLKNHNLVFVNTLLPLPISSLKTPNYFSASEKKAFSAYKAAPPHKAFAASKKGGYGWRSGQRSKELAEKNALAMCKQYNANGCKLLVVDDESFPP